MTCCRASRRQHHRRPGQGRPRWTGRASSRPKKPETKVLIEGDGKEVADGDKVEVNVWIGNGYTQKEAYTTYEKGGSPETFTVDDQLSPVFKDALVGQTIGSRVAVVTPSSEVFGEAGNAQMDIGNQDSVVIVLDLMEMFQPPRAPKDVGANRMPKVVEEKGDPVSLDFTGLPEPKADANLLRYVVKEGDGEALTTTSTVTADYLGMVYKGKEPFDESFSKEPAEFSLDQVVQGVDLRLAGLKVGTRVLLQIPPALGYGAQAQDGHPGQQLALLRHRHRRSQVAG